MARYTEHRAAPGPWVADAACSTPDAPSMEGDITPYFRASPAYRRHIERLRNICHTCPVLERCREWALTTPDPAAGHIAGGLTPTERKSQR